MDNRGSPPVDRNAENARRRRRAQNIQLRGMSPPPRIQMTHPTQSIDNRAPLQVAPPRLFANPGTTHLQRHRLRRQREDDAFGTVQDAVNRLNEVTSNLTSVLDEPLPQILGPDDFTGLIDDMDGYNRRSKRRKLDSDPLDTQPSFSYGYHGQVAPGRLKMMISSCDGGHLLESDELLPQKNYHPENVLHNDKSVYCSKKDKCNIVLKHWGETPFTVTKIIVKAPDSGFTAPVQEGMVFLSMSNEQLASRTSRYQIRDTCPHTLTRQSSERLGGHPNDDPRPSLNEPYYSQRTGQPSVRMLPPGNYFQPVSGTESPDTDSTPPPDDVYPHPRIQQPNGSFHQSQEPSAPFGYRITTSCDEPSGDEEEPSSPSILLDRQRRRYRVDESSTSEDDDEPRIRYHRQRCDPRTIERMDGDSESESRRPPQELMPYAKFFIERRKYVVSLKFDPPISARYVLLKLWSPQGHGNIDIQNISIHGFAGPRYFPAISMA